MVEVTTLLTPEDVERMHDRGEIDPEADFELVDGEIVWLTKPSDPRHARIAVLIIVALHPFAQRIGAWLMDESYLYRTTAERRNLRAPDIAMTSKERLHLFPSDRGWGTEAPDLCVEILSPGEYGESYARRKVPEYLAAGAKVVWLVHPRNCTVRAFEAGRDEVATYSGEAGITLDAIAPGFQAAVSSFFPG